MSVLSKAVNRRIGRSMHDYSMLADGDRVLIAVSGGVDSLVLSWILNFWQSKAPIRYTLQAIYIDNGFDAKTSREVEKQLSNINISYRIEKTDFWKRAKEAEDGKSVCYHCARLRRNLLFATAEQHGFNKIAFGHHKDDIIETFFINLLYAGNISTMVPKQELFDGSVKIIRPMAYLEKNEILKIAENADILPVKNPCPKDNDSKRQAARKVLASLSALDPKVKSNIFAALSNIREEYLLTNHS
ncbi:MAG: tRNA lysidine(34) synthetase TilS [Deltaproteobacteria bacterium]|jgi:tRNA 2-thiocytidine biosynthesis protein TtcA|nr:tRNA lysidine(34) synthetase TilS [Deltaproteobacteria bacterium]